MCRTDDGSLYVEDTGAGMDLPHRGVLMNRKGEQGMAPTRLAGTQMLPAPNARPHPDLIVLRNVLMQIPREVVLQPTVPVPGAR
jgi:hypothetical protein